MTEQHSPHPFVWTVGEDERLIREYIRVGTPVDHLAYTDAFEKLFKAFVSDGAKVGRADVFRRLLSLRKRGQMPRLFRADGALGPTDDRESRSA